MTDESKCPTPQIPGFELIREIGRGSFGQVWLARNRATGLLRAVKLIARSPTSPVDPAGRELVSIMRLETMTHRQHPNLLDIHHVGQTDELLFLVTDLADATTGESCTEPLDYAPATLAQRLSHGLATPRDCLDWTRQLLQGLACLHEAGMVHRDVKPANCLFVEGQLKLTDFGLLTQASSQASRIGTQAYMPPDGQMDTRADVYAAGLVIYEMITGHGVEQFPQLAERTDPISADATLSVLLKLVLDACQTERVARFPDAQAMLAALEQRLVQASLPPRWKRRAVIAVVAIAVLATVVWVGLGGAFTRHVHANFVTYPFGASVLLDGRLLLDSNGHLAKTPCTIDNITACPHEVEFQHPDFPDLKLGAVDFRTQRQIVGSWDVPATQSEVPLVDLPHEDAALSPDGASGSADERQE